MRKAVLVLTAITVIALCAVADAQQGRGTFTYQTVDVPGATATQVNGMNAQGELVGSYTLNGVHGFLLSKGEFVTIDVPDPTAYYTSPWDVTANGQAVGIYGSTALPPGCPDFTNWLRGFVWSGGVFEPVDIPGACYTVAYATNAAGDIVGEHWIDGRPVGYLLRNGVYTTLDIPDPDTEQPWNAAMGINARGSIVGWYGDGASYQFHGYLLRDGQVTTLDLPGFTNVLATAINDHDEVIVRGGGPVTSFSYVWREGELTPIEFPGASYTNVLAINNRGDVAGRYQDSDGKTHGFVAYKRAVRQD